jgi:phosphoglycolate phosphatase-like HAD superfamily hydrolase
LKEFNTIFWDFDGVIKDSVEVKTAAYIKLFEAFGLGVVEKVRHHHECNGGMSRFDKFPIYLKWAGIEPTPDYVEDYSDKFSKLVVQGVIDSPWVSGAEQYIRNNKYKQTFVLVSATPQYELEFILDVLDLTKCFTKVFGAPTSKKSAIANTLKDLNLDSSTCLMIGDAIADVNAASINNVHFLLRRHIGNAKIFSAYTGRSIEQF